MALAQVSNQLLRSQGNDTTTVATNYPITGDGSTQLPLGLAEDYRGADGESLTFNITDIADGHRVTISGIQGSSSFDVLDGQDGANGVNGVNGADGQSVTFDITNIASGHRVTLSGAQGSASFDVMNGQDGVDGVSPTFRFSESEDGVTVFVSGAQGEESFRLYNGTSGNTYSAGPNIDIYPVDDQLYISGTDWTSTIESAVSSKMDKSESGNFYPMTGNPSGFLTAVDLSNYYQKTETSSKEEISAALTGKLDKSESGNFYPMTGNPSGFLTAHQDLSNLPYVQNSALGYTPSTFVSSISGHELYAESANHAFTAETANYVEGGWEYDSENHISSYNGSAFVGQNQVTYDVKASSNINVATAGNTFTVSGKDWTNEITAASAYAASQAQGKTYTGVAPIVVNNSEDKISADCARLSAVAPLNMTDEQVGNVMYTKLSANCIELSAGNGIDSVKLATGIIEVSSQGGTNFVMTDGTSSYSAIGFFDQVNDPGCYQIMGTANNGPTTPGQSFGYTLPTQSRVFSADCVNSAKNYTDSAISAHIRLIHYPDITFSAVRDTIKAGGIVVPYETTQGYSTFYNFVASSVADSTSSYKFDYIGTNGYATVLTVSSYNDGATTGVHRDYRHIFLAPSACECKVVLVATSGDIPASGATDGKLYVVTGLS